MTEEKRWLRQAEKDLDTAKDSLTDKHYEWACFQAQQSAEKAPKGFLYTKGLRAILTHSIRDLVFEGSKYERELGKLVEGGKFLDAFYIPTRYPNSLISEAIPAEYYSAEDAEKCISCAELILSSVTKLIRQ